MIELALAPEGQAAQVGVAGDVLNTAIYLRRALPAPHEVAFGSALGTDPLSDRIAAFAERHGIDCARLHRVGDRGPGLYAITVDAEGERSFTYWRDRSAARVMFGPDAALDYAMLDGAKVILFSGITLAILSPAARDGLLTAVAAVRARGAKVVFDSNYRPRLWDSAGSARRAIDSAWTLADIGFPSLDDEMTLFGETPVEAAARLAGYPMEVCVLKRGAEGAEILRPRGVGIPPSSTAPVKVVDTTGAGDSFNGAFLAKYLAGAGLAAAMDAARRTAARVVGEKGAIAPDPACATGPDP